MFRILILIHLQSTHRKYLRYRTSQLVWFNFTTTILVAVYKHATLEKLQSPCRQCVSYCLLPAMSLQILWKCQTCHTLRQVPQLSRVLCWIIVYKWHSHYILLVYYIKIMPLLYAYCKLAFWSLSYRETHMDIYSHSVDPEVSQNDRNMQNESWQYNKYRSTKTIFMSAPCLNEN